MKTDTNVPEVKAIFKEIMEAPEKMFELFRIDMKQACERAVTELIKVELSGFLGRDKYQHFTNPESVPEKNYRNGSYSRKYTVKNIGTLDINVARDRLGEFESKLVNKYERYEKAIEKDIALMYLSGLSTRGISLISKTLLGRKISPSEVEKSSRIHIPLENNFHIGAESSFPILMENKIHTPTENKIPIPLDGFSLLFL